RAASGANTSTSGANRTARRSGAVMPGNLRGTPGDRVGRGRAATGGRVKRTPELYPGLSAGPTESESINVACARGDAQGATPQAAFLRRLRRRAPLFRPETRPGGSR